MKRSAGRTPFLSRRLALSLACGVSAISAVSVASDGAFEKDFSGTYVLVQENVSRTKLPVVADIVTTTRTISLQKLTHEGDRLVGDGDVCELTMSSSSDLVVTEIPLGFRKALPKVRVDARLTRRDGKVFFSQAPKTLVLGARLGHVREALPETPADRRVWDQDKDGHPGMTVRVSGLVSGDVYMASRSTSSLDGQLVGSEFRGALRFRSEESILDATHPFLRSGANSEPDLERSRFRLVPISAGATCAEAIRNFATRR